MCSSDLNDDRESLVWGAKLITNESGKMFNEKMSQYADIATSYDVDPELITSGMTPFTEYTFEDKIQQNTDNQPKQPKQISQEALEYTAQLRGLSVNRVKEILGVK